MHTILIIAGIALAVFLFFFIKNIARHKMFRRGWAIFIWRWFSGAHWSGVPQTDAGWLRRGEKALTQTKYAPRYYFWPRWQRAVMRCGLFFVPPLLILGVLIDLTLTLGTGSALMATGLGYAGFKSLQVARQRSIARDWLQPLHMRIAPLAGVPLSASPRSWLQLEPGVHASIALPPSFNDSEPQRERLQTRAMEALAMEQAEAHWSFAGKNQLLELEASAPPPNYVNLGAVWAAIKEAKSDELILGLGRKSLPVGVSLHLDSPHVGASMGGGAGKSTLARFIAAQAMYHGAIVVFLDIKRISHAWARTAKLPNMIYADTPELIHETLIWAGGELDRRNEVALIGADSEGEVVSGSVGSRIIIIAEELNLTANRLRTYWNELQVSQGLPPALSQSQSPALIALQDIAFAGRQVLMNIVFIGQMLTARVTGGQQGGNEARENMGIRMLARYTQRNWKLLVPEHTMPLASDVLGRIQVIASGVVRECQVPYITGTEAATMSVGGVIGILPPNIPPILLDPYASIRHLKAHPEYGRVPDDQVSEIVTDRIPELEIVSDGSGDVFDDSTVNVSGMPPVSLSEVIDQNIFSGWNLAQIKKARQRDPTFPEPLGLRGTSHVYDLGQLAVWIASKGKKSS